ncbi:MAG: DNA-protecting protein DprA [Burkholderiales bacterium]|nr:DNA-protecting protein DprA [Anaerolineae bacterium]
MDERKYWLGFSLVPDIGPKRLARLLNAFGSLSNAWQADERALYESGLEERPTENLNRVRRQIDLDAQMARVEKAGARLMTLADDDYPPLLRQVPDAPTVLYVRGTITPPDELALAIVGTRKATNYGYQAAYRLAEQLARRGITVISGLAQGIDTAAHRGAIDGGGRTFAILGCGVDVAYPRENETLMRSVIECGAVISELPLGTPPDARNFPPRNRIISGLSLGVLVIEAPEKSGALITASTAAEQGREVFAVPGNIFNRASSGTNRLIQDGAKLVMKVEDILEELNIAHDRVQTRRSTEGIASSSSANSSSGLGKMNESEARLMEHLNADPTHIDDLVRLCGLPVAAIHSALTMLELKGLARNVGHMQYSRIR